MPIRKYEHQQDETAHRDPLQKAARQLPAWDERQVVAHAGEDEDPQADECEGGQQA
jgi:hypothetical protein